MPESDPDPNDPERGLDPLWVLLVMLALLGAALYVSFRLIDASKTQDCVMQGRTNCGATDDAPITK